MMTEHAAGVCEPIGVFAGGRIQQNAGGLERLRTQDHRLAANLLRLLRGAMDESYTPRFVRAGIHVHVADDCVSDQRAAAGLQSVSHGGERTAEVGIGKASPLTRTAVVAWCAAVMWLGQNCCAPDGERTPKILLNTLAQPYFTATHLHRRQKLPIRQH